MVLKINSDDGKVVTLIRLENVFSVKAKDDENGKPQLIFKSIDGSSYESFTFETKKSRDNYLEFIEEILEENEGLQDDAELDDEDDESDNETLEPEYPFKDYDPMNNIRGDNNE